MTALVVGDGEGISLVAAVTVLVLTEEEELAGTTTEVVDWTVAVKVVVGSAPVGAADAPADAVAA